MDFFKNFSNKKQNNESVPVTLDLRDNGFILNGTSFPFPARASELIKLLGEPRIAENQYMDKLKEIYCKEYHFDSASFNPWDYYWDNAGIIARTFEHETVHSLIIYLRKSKYPFPMPKCIFSGTLLINGQTLHEYILKEGSLRNYLQLGNIHCNVSIYGKNTNEKDVCVMQLGLNDDVKLEFFE